MDPIATTALYTAMLRARESARPDRLFSDPFAEVLAGPQGNDVLALLEVSSSAGSPNPVIPIRTRFFDDALADVIGRSFLTSPRLAGLRTMMAANGVPFRSVPTTPKALWGCTAGGRR